MRITFDPDHHIWEATAPSDESREVLKGVCADTKGCLVAADGFLLAVVPCQFDRKPKANVVIPAAIVKAAADTAGDQAVIEVQQGVATAVIGTYRHSAPLIPVKYPDWRALFGKGIQVLPDWAESVPDRVAFNGLLLERLSRAIGHNGESLSLRHYGSNLPILADGAGGAFGLFMPLWIGWLSDESAFKERFQRYGIKAALPDLEKE